MINDLNEQIDKTKELLENLPKNNKKNIKSYNEEVLNNYNYYKDLSNKLNNELLNRKNKLNNIKVNDNINKLKEEINLLEEDLNIICKYNTSYEKTNLDKYIYDISKYYKYNLDKVNLDITNIYNIFNSNNINLVSDNFFYSKYLKEYMTSFNKEEELQDLFESIYWKCSNILIHAELNFKSLYIKNKNIFDKSIKLKESKIDKTSILDRYYKLKKDLDILIFSDKYTIYNNFKNRVLNINEFKTDQIKSSYQTIFGKDYSSIDIEDVINYYFALKEYTDYLEVSYIFLDAKKILSNRKTYKSKSKSLLRSIKKEEFNLKKVNRKLEKNDNGKLLIKENSIIDKLKELYDNLSNSTLLDRLNKYIEDNTTYNEVLEIYTSNYLYLLNLIKSSNEDISIEDINKLIDTSKNILNSPYKSFMTHTLIGEEKDIKLVFSDCYSLVSYNINDELLDNVDEINNLRDKIYKIIIYYYIEKLNIDIDNIEFFCNI